MMTMLNGAILAVLLAASFAEDVKQRQGALLRVWQNMTEAEADIKELFGYYREIMLAMGRIPKGYIGYSCNEDSDCDVVDKSVCIDDKCVCDPGLVFSSTQHACLDRASCTKFGSTFTEIRGYYIGHHNERTYSSGVSPEQCKKKCASYNWCLSADRRTSDGRCDLAKVTLKDVSSADYRIVDDKTIITHYSRDCED